MKRLIIGKLELALMGRNELLIDWNMQEPGNRWRLQVGKALWIPMGEKPTRRGKYWAWFAKGNERKRSPNWYGLDTEIDPNP